MDKWVSLKPGSNGSDLQSHNVSIPFKFSDNMVCRPDITNLPAAQETWTNIPVAQQYWLLVSGAVTSPTQDPVIPDLGQINLSVYQQWRDQHGTS
jgi:hypothetical protein